MLRLTEERQRRGWSQARLARAARIDQAMMSRIEGGKLRPYACQLRRLARALGWPAGRADELLADVAGERECRIDERHCLGAWRPT
jgi:transcriptional regulator with XRE-family HTH domain